MPVYAKGKGRWLVVIYTRGVRQDRIVRGSKKDAEDYEAHERIKLEIHGKVERRAVPSFSAFCLAEYARHAKLHLSPRTWGVRRHQLVTLMQFFGDAPLTDVPAKVDAFKAWRTGANVKPISINNELAVLSTVLAFAREKNLPVRPAKLRKLPVPQKNRTTVWSESQVGNLFRALHEMAPSIVPLVAFIANTGCREGEALIVPKAAVDLDRRIVRIWTLDDTHAGEVGTWSPKWGREREVPVNDALLPVIVEQLQTSGRWLFPCKKGTPYKRWPHDLFNPARKAAGLTGGPHTLRHTYASHFLKNQPDLYLLAQVMGHSHSRVTELYAHVLPGHLAKARNVVAFDPTKVPTEDTGEKPCPPPCP